MILFNQSRPLLLLTHPTPDLDAIGFVYAALKVWGAGTPVACRTPAEAELTDPAVVVGDIGRPGCEAIACLLNNIGTGMRTASAARGRRGPGCRAMRC